MLNIAGCALLNIFNRIVDINKTLPPDQKIRVMSMSIGWKPDFRGYKEIDAAVNRARSEGILVISTVMGNYFGVNLAGLERAPQKDPDKLDSYQSGLFLQPFYYKNLDRLRTQSRKNAKRLRPIQPVKGIEFGSNVT